GHPRKLKETIPATLLHPAFGQFINDSQTHTTTEDDNNIVHELANVMLAFYKDEKSEWKHKVQDTAYAMDADMFIDIHNHHHLFVIAKFKNKAATSNSEPYLQALSYYLESIRTYAPRMSESALPCLLLIHFG
ncbi:uncharacterized protein F5891DRAFT_925229, partial [Suillus fuscotomentosus]